MLTRPKRIGDRPLSLSPPRDRGGYLPTVKRWHYFIKTESSAIPPLSRYGEACDVRGGRAVFLEGRGIEGDRTLVRMRQKKAGSKRKTGKRKREVGFFSLLHESARRFFLDCPGKRQKKLKYCANFKKASSPSSRIFASMQCIAS